MELKTQDGFVLIKSEDLHRIKDLALRIRNFSGTYSAYNKKLNVLINDVGVYGSFSDTYSAFNRKLNGIIKQADEVLHTEERG